MKKILVVYYSQSGQLQRVVETITSPLVAAADVELQVEPLRPAVEYPYPWPLLRFLDAFPESVRLDPPPLQPPAIDREARYDLVILAYTVWFLAPAPPVVAFLRSEVGRAVLRDTPVITVIACRNMWHLAQEKMKTLLREAGARLSDNVVLVDQGSSLATFVTTPRWMLTGRRDRLWGLFPPAGVAEEEIAASARFGHAILDALRQGSLDGRRPVLTGLRAVKADIRLVPGEKIATRSFLIWSRLIRLMGLPGSPGRKPVLLIYLVFLLAMIMTVVPISMALRALLRPLFARRLEAQRLYFEGPSGRGEERMREYARMARR
ncbi:MAG TPA: dialkylresorcinol condensing enzyme [Desulfurivibrio alkaliphilus]|uniref:Dialkylresorcinol condensing enzyme n=1 Tax=Desulfurivibrio alkaliphilus TaxID=427923 RepID=A0A7C2XNN7_9BACT|nr:dialkylresorcinol condensing enzyme [Desulfurivibrio alkaliphilus]